MNRKKPLTDAIRFALGVGAGTLALGAVPGAFAQDNDEVIEEIITTGSRIPVDANLVNKSPVTTLTDDDFTHGGITRVEDLLNDLPQVVPELTSTDTNGSTGTATLDLRGLGSDRTLVLVNGHRMGFGDPFALAPDVNQIPGNLIERVELLTGGASSTYGSDAVAGVVNFIMKDNFEGFQLDYQISGYQHKNDNSTSRAATAAAGFEQAPSSVSDGRTHNINLSLGVNTADGRGNITGYIGYREINAIKHSERDVSACALSSTNGTTCAGSATLPTGLFTPFDGSFYYTVAGDQFIPWDYTYYNYGPLNFFQRPDERWTGGFFGHYDISENIEGYAEFQFMDDRSNAQIAPSGAFFSTATLNCSNAFLSAQQFGAIGCVNPTDVVPLYIGRRNVEGGPRNDDLRHTSMRALVGFRGDITDNWSYDISGNFARMRYSEVYNNDVSITKYARALDAVDDGNGNIVCASVLNGVDPACVPWNVFQTDGVTDAALAYIDLPLFSKSDMEMNQVVAFVTGDLGLTIPSADDSIQLVVGAEYRDESMDFNPDAGYRAGDASGQGGSVVPVNGNVIVKEYFAETAIPIVQGKTAFESLSLDLRYRRSDYDTGFDVNTWNVGAEWTPVESLMIRGGKSQAVRAPNILELFQPVNSGLWDGTDPCGGATPLLTEAQCANTGVLPGQYGTIPLSPAGQYNGIFGGNLALGPETSDSITIGAVYTPDNILSGLSLSVDYWSIDVQDAISTVDAEFTINQCATTNDASFCNMINRGPNGNLWIGNANVVQQNINVGFLDVAGYDITGIYRMDIGNHGLDFNLRGTLVSKWDSQPVSGGVVNDCVGKFGGDCERPKPEWKHTFNTLWSTPWDVQVVGTWRYIGETEEFQTQRFKTDATNYFDLSGTYYADWWGGEATISAGVTNITDEDPPANGFLGAIGTYGNGNTIPGQWDALGRYWFVGFTYAR